MTRLAPFSDQWPAISALLDEVLLLPATEQAAWLASLSGERAAHREALQLLLAQRAQVETDDFLGQGPQLPIPPHSNGTDDGPAPSTLGPGAQVGAYRLIHEIARGGMGTVWLAERSDGSMKRRVALKLPRVVWGDALAERLAREREILETLEHEHIARLYDAGVDAQGRPFLAMEYVEGQPIDAYCRARSPGVRERLGLLLQVMAAVAHAHARLVVHRDLKPGNILVTEAGQVRLLDFGIAKLLEGDRTRATALTELAGRALTLDYASPEQIRGEPLGTASDIYSMAVVAYELLAGTRPYRLKGSRAAELEQAIAEAQAPLASAQAARATPDGGDGTGLARQLRGDLDAILNKALKKAPAERYATMDAFAQDLRRHLDGEPVLARPDGLGYRLAKFVGRHRLQVAAGGVAVLALAVGASVAVWQAREARLAAAEARTEAATAKAVQGFIESVFIANSGNQADPKAARSATARELLDRGAARIDQDLADEPEAQLRLYDLLGEMYLHMAMNDRALALQRRSLALTTRLHGADSLEALGAALSVAKTLGETGERQEALTMLLRADEILRARGETDPLARMDVDSNLAALYLYTDPPQGLERARRAAVIARQQPPSQASVNTLHMLGETAYATGHLEEARDALLDAAAHIERKPEETMGALPLVLSTLGAAQDKLGDAQAAGATLARAYALAQKVSDPYTLNIAGFKLARHQAANCLLREAVATASTGAAWARSLGDDHEFGSAPALMIGGYGHILLGYGDATQALVTLDDALKRLPPGMPETLGPLLAARADALLAVGRRAEAGELLERAQALVGGRPDNALTVDAVRRRLLAATGRADEALQQLRERRAASASKAQPIAALRDQAEEAALLLAAGRPAEARAAATAVLAGIESSPQRAYLRRAEAQATDTLGQALLRERSAAEARPVLEKALALDLAEYDPVHSPVVALAKRSLAEARAQ